MVTGLAAPVGALTQSVGARLSVYCSTNPGEFVGVQESVMNPGADVATRSVGPMLNTYAAPRSGAVVSMNGAPATTVVPSTPTDFPKPAFNWELGTLNE